jgi:hypothetical protein
LIHGVQPESRSRTSLVLLAFFADAERAVEIAAIDLDSDLRRESTERAPVIRTGMDFRTNG